MSVRVFVYGTLMRGRANHRVLERLGARFVATAQTRDRRTLIDLGPYPALLPADSARDFSRCPAFGELHELDEAALAELDAFEGCPDLFRREPIEVEHQGDSAETFAYVLAVDAPAAARVVDGGRYDGAGRTFVESAREADAERDR